MTPENFAYWLQGALELGKQVTFERDQVIVIQDHLNLVFKKETPNRTSIRDEILKRFPNDTQPFTGLPPAPLITTITC